MKTQRPFCLAVLFTVFLFQSLYGNDFVRNIVKMPEGGKQLLDPARFRPYEKGFVKESDSVFVCDNGPDSTKRSGVAQSLVLDQKTPTPIVASAWSRGEDVGGNPDSNYAIYLDLTYQDGTNLWGQAAPFETGTTDWKRQELILLPEKPIKSLSFYTLFRNHSGKAFFRDLQLREINVPEGAALFDGVPTILSKNSRKTPALWIRDVAANGDFLDSAKYSQGLEVERREVSPSVSELTISSRDETDRILEIAYTIPVSKTGLRYFENPRSSVDVKDGLEYSYTGTHRIGGNGRLSKYPFLAVARETNGQAVGIDMQYPFYFRTAYNAATEELFVAGDIALTKEKKSATIRLCRFEFDGEQGFRGALSEYYRLFPEAFRVRVPKQGVWMPFAAISKVDRWEDFGFVFKEGNNETAWDDEHGILTFRYTEPLTWWMSMPEATPRTMDAAMGEVRRLAESGNKQAQALLSSGFQKENGERIGLFQNTPWTNGIVWSMNDSPNLPSGKRSPNGFEIKWNREIFDKLYGPGKKADLDGEYVDSSECYVTAELDFCRDHFAATRHPLTFSQGSNRPGIFRGLIVQEYIEAMGRDVHGIGKLMMANSTPHRLCWLLPLLDVAGTETNWNREGRWNPMSDAELLYIRSLCGKKPFCFLMNTDFTKFPFELTSRFMKRCLAYGMFPGFFSADASTKHYFSQPELYNRDRPLFKKFVPLCKMVAEAGWEPITGGASDDPNVHIERFGNDAKKYLTVFNDSRETKTVSVTLTAPFLSAGKSVKGLKEHVRGQWIPIENNSFSIQLGPEDVVLVESEP